ncbi:MAG TPA: histidine phosphatase family protein [Dehalococcoidales bacterium]|nr:histidine phosphatase family protein [Dehalococcoidales bacterium]
MARLLLIRHGETKLYKADRFWGSTDVDLSENGIKQAGLLSDRLAKTKIDAVYTSPLLRASVTADVIAAKHKIKTAKSDDLCECSFGYAEGLTFAEITQKYPELAEDLAAGTAITFPGGESLAQLDKRVKKFLVTINDLKPSAKAVIVAHGGPLRLLICNLLNLGIEHWLQFRIDHASLSVIETYPQGNILNLLNDVSHLK